MCQRMNKRPISHPDSAHRRSLRPLPPLPPCLVPAEVTQTVVSATRRRENLQLHTSFHGKKEQERESEELFSIQLPNV